MSSEIKALYAGSFDPPTNGHDYVIQKASRLFPYFEVQIGANPDKKYMFDTEERITLVERIVAPLGNVAVSSLDEGFTIEYAYENGFTHMVKGLRNAVDFQYEENQDDASQLYLKKLIERDVANGRICPDAIPEIDSVLFKSPQHLRTVSSSFIRTLTKVKGWEKITPDLVPPAVMEALKEKIGSSTDL